MTGQVIANLLKIDDSVIRSRTLDIILKTFVTEVKQRPLRIMFGWGDHKGRIISARATVYHVVSDH